MSSLFDQTRAQGAPPKHFLLWSLPILLLLILIGLFVWVGIEEIIPTLIVDAVKVRLAEGNVAIHEPGGTIFQAAGWIEPDPYAIKITALVSGIVKKIYVISGQKVKKGQLLVELVDEDLALDLQQAQTRLSELLAQITTKKAVVVARKADEHRLSFEVETAKSILRRLEHRADSLAQSSEAISRLEKEQAQLQVSEQQMRIMEFVGKKKVLQAATQLAKSRLQQSQRQLQSHKVHIAKIKLNIERLQVKSPINGRIQRLYARQGRKQMLQSDHELSTTIAEVYDPKNLQVRVDVPLSDISKVSIGQKTQIHVEASDKVLQGKVTLLGGEADYQKNTLEVKVRIYDPLDILRPDMLAQVKFLKEPSKEQKVLATSLFVRKDCLRGDKKDLYVWLVSVENRLVKRKIKQIGERQGWVAIASGLHAGDRVITGSNESLLHVNGKVKIRRLYE